MELNSYQEKVILDLNDYLEELNKYGSKKLNQSFASYWLKKGVANQNYIEKIPNTPHVCESAYSWRKNLYCRQCLAIYL